MQIPRRWRMQKQMYRLQGFMYEDGTYSMTGGRRFKTAEIESEAPSETPIEVPNWPKNERALKKPGDEG